MDGKRIFLAIDISDAARAVCSSHIDSLQNDFPQVRVGWERREKLHITLKFLGPTTPDKLIELSRLAADVAARHNPFALRLASPGSFPAKGKPRVLWVGTEGQTDQLTTIQNELERACSSIGFDREENGFHPHITIGRIRDHRDAFALAEAHRAARIEPAEFEVREIVIYESKLHPTGSVYSKLAALPFRVRKIDGSQ